MLKVNISDLIKILTIDESGVCDDGTKRTWIKCSALSFFDEEETYISLFAFGYTADMVLDNHTGDNMRRAMVSGTLEIEEGYEFVKIDFNGVKKSVKVPKPQYKIVADTLRFVDKNNWGETPEADIVADEDEDEVIDLTAGTAGKSKTKESAASNSDRKRRKRRDTEDEEERPARPRGRRREAKFVPED